MTNQEAIEVLKGILTEATEYENAVCYVTGEDRKPLEMAIEALENQKIGHWIKIDDFYMAKCSECGRFVDSRMIIKYPYCHCGAKMKGE